MKLYIIPAYGENIRSNNGYKEIISEAKKRKYKVEVLNLQIKNKSLADLTNKGVKAVGKNHKCAIFGFSMGALIAYNISTIIPVDKLILASLSPALWSDMKRHKKSMTKWFGKKTVNELEQTRYNKSLARKVIFLHGEKEHKSLINRTKKLYYKRIGGKKLTVVRNNNHELTSDYVNNIVKNL